ncbi:MAG: zinc ribbon domain-containing protein [Lachnospiraceae bacterium]|nr:zinc ribbon domain-containing protein [Lachnospiraceae bacterium]
MSRCHHCQIEIIDRTETCPLCQGVLEIGGETDRFYPDIPGQQKRFLLIRRIFTFVSLVAISLCLFIDYHTEQRMNWSFIASGGIFLALTLFWILTNPNTGYRSRIIFSFCLVFAYLLLIDIITGFSGWSVNFVLPGAIFLINLVLLFLMIYNRRSWQSYMILQIGCIWVGAIPIALIYAGIVRYPVLSELAFGSSVFLFIGTLIFGGQAAKMELQRRFYI